MPKFVFALLAAPFALAAAPSLARAAELPIEDRLAHPGSLPLEQIKTMRPVPGDAHGGRWVHDLADH